MQFAGFALALGLASFTSTGKVWIVDDDGGPGVDYKEIWLGVKAALDGDVVLVRAGVYDPFTITGESIVVQRDGPGTVKAQGVVEGLAAGQRVLLRGLTLSGGMRVLDNQGPVWLEDCSFVESMANSLRIENSVSVVVTRCSNDYPGYSDHGISSQGSDVVIQDSVFSGGYGLPAWTLMPGLVIPAGPGGHGALLQQGAFEVENSTFVGGQGGSDGGCPCPPGAGGHGVHVVEGALRHSTSVYVPGAGGYSGYYGTSGDGVPIKLTSSTELVVAETALSIEAESPVDAGTHFDVALTGPPGSLAFLGLGGGPGWIAAPALLHPALIDGPYTVIPLGALDAAGGAHVSVAVAEQPGVKVQTLWCQGLLITPVGGLLPGGVSAVTAIK